MYIYWAKKIISSIVLSMLLCTPLSALAADNNNMVLQQGKNEISPDKPPDKPPDKLQSPNNTLPPDVFRTTSGESPMVVKLKFLKADVVKGLLSSIVPDDKIRVEATGNRLVISCSQGEQQSINSLLAKIDLPPKQVMYEVQIIESSLDNSKSSGITWGSATIVPALDTTSSLGTAFIKLGTQNGSDFGTNLQATINHQITEKKAKVLANPKIATLDGQTASIIIGDKLPIISYQVVNGSTVSSVTYIEVNIKLEVTPIVNDDGTITTHIKPEISNPTTYTNGNPNIRTRQADTNLRVKNGDTIVLGGLIQDQGSESITRVPFLSDIPIVGRLFTSTDTLKTKTELIILITPKIMVD